MIYIDSFSFLYCYESTARTKVFWITWQLQASLLWNPKRQHKHTPENPILGSMVSTGRGWDWKGRLMERLRFRSRYCCCCCCCSTSSLVPLLLASSTDSNTLLLLLSGEKRAISWVLVWGDELVRLELDESLAGRWVCGSSPRLRSLRLMWVFQ